MTLPILETSYTRALRLLGLRPASRQLSTPLTVQSVQIVSDVGDVSIPHSNPIWASTILAPPVVGEFSVWSLIATNRLLKIRQLLTTQLAELEVFVGLQYTPTAAGVLGSFGPFGRDAQNGLLREVPTALVQVGSDAANIMSTDALISPIDVQIDYRPPLLIAPGSALHIQFQTANIGLTVSEIHEEIPAQDAVSQVGFPTVAES